MANSRITLRSKLTGAFLAPTLIIALLYGLVTYFSSRQGLEDELAQRLIAVAQATAATMNDGFDAKQIERLDGDKPRVHARLKEKLDAVRKNTGVRRVFIFDKEKRSLVDTDDVEFGQPLYDLDADAVELERTFADATPTASVLFEGNDGALYKSGYAPIVLEGRVVAAIGVEGSAGYFDLLTNLASVLTVLGIFGVLLVIIVGTLSARRITQPVNELMVAAQRLGRGELDGRVLTTATSGDEITYLAEAFEDMRQDIVGRDQQLQMMLSGIAHEVRNPLGGMKLFVGLLKEDLRDADDSDDQLAKVARIERELGYLEKVVNDFLDYAKQGPVELERFSGAEFLDEIDDLLRAEVEGAGSTLSIDVQPSDVELTADRARIRRGVINCLRNAYQALEGGGRIEITVTADDVARFITIRDDGPGIPEESLDEVLTPFFTTKEKGSGLGLSLTKRVVEQHGGSLHIRNDGGCVIVFEIPFDASIVVAEPEIPEGWLG